MSLALPKYFINLQDVEANGFLATLTSAENANDPRYIRNDQQERLLVFVYPSANGGPPFREIDTDLVEGIRVAVGVPDAPPTAGTFTATVNAVSLGSFAFDVSAASLQAAISAQEPVTVTKNGTLYVIVVTATNTSITLSVNPTNLRPPTVATIGNPVAAAVGVNAVYTLMLAQEPYALQETWTVRDTSGDLVDIDAINPGSSSELAQYLVTVTPDPQSGSFQFNHGEAQVSLISVQSNAATQQVWDITTVANVANSLDTKYFDLSDANGPVRTYINTSGTCAPNPVGTITSVDEPGNTITSSVSLTSGLGYMFTGTPPAGLNTIDTWYPLTTGTTVQLSISPGGSPVNITNTTAGATIHRSRAFLSAIPADTAQILVAGYIADTLESDPLSAFTTTIDADGLLTATAATGGTRSYTSGGTSGFTVSINTEGLAGQLRGSGFVLDDANGTAGIYITVDSLPSTPPEFAANASRQIPIAVAGAASANSAATTIAAALDLDGAWNAAASGNQITATDAVIGARTGTTTASAGYFSVTIAQTGFVITATIDIGLTASQIEQLPVGSLTLGDYWTVSSTAPFSWLFTRTTPVVVTPPTVDDTSVVWVIGFTGIIPFVYLALFEAFAALPITQDITNAVLEIKITLTGEEERVALQVPATLARDLLNGAPTGGPIYNSQMGIWYIQGVTGYTGGGGTNLDGVATANIPASRLPIVAEIIHATDGAKQFQLITGTTAEASPGVIRPDDYHGTTNPKVWISVL